MPSFAGVRPTFQKTGVRFSGHVWKARMVETLVFEDNSEF